MYHSNFVHLHVHTYYSLLDGACSIEELAKRAKEFKMPALAMTDHGNLFAAIPFYQTLSKEGIKPLIGCECYLLTEGSHRDRDLRSKGFLSHITLLVKNKIGYKNLCKLIASSYLDGFYYKPRIDKELLREHAEGLIALSGCLKGEVPSLFAQGRDQDAEGAADCLASVFEGDRFYLELMDHGIPSQAAVNEKLISLARRKGWPLVATNDVHYLDSDHAEVHDALLCIQTGKVLQDEKRMRMGSQEFYFKSPQQMMERFQHVPEAISNTVEIAEKLNLEFDFQTYHFPQFVPPEGEELGIYLETEAKKGLENYFSEFPTLAQERDKYQSRLERELETIRKMGFSGYFLIVADFINFAKKRDLPVGPGRGSAAGSLVAFCLGITNIDPLQHGLLFERFLNPERISMPDVDIDFCMRRRDEVIQYVAQKYGNVSQIITFGKMKARAVVRDVGRVLGMPYGEVDRIAKLIPATLGMTLADAFVIEPKLNEMGKSSPQVAKLLEVARSLEGFPRHASTHAAGVVISDRPLSDYLPLCRGQHDEVVTQFDMKGVEKIGLIKFDFLGLKTLTVIDDTLRLIKKHRGGKIDINKIPLDDPLVYQRLSEGDTSGIFQLESQGMTALIQKLKPSVFADIVALVALFRPGPLGSGMVDDFINRKHGRTAIQYELPELASILKDTYGVIVYQEQVMQIASELGDFSLGEADLLRRAMGKKLPEEMAEQRERFLKGARSKKIPPKKAEKIFDLMAKFAEYGFNKSHSAAYALVSYQTAYLKTHYPTEYMAALLTSEQTNTDKVLTSIGDCRSHGLTILPPDVNESEHNFSVVGEGKIRFGLGAVKNVGEAAIENIVKAREAGGHYASLIDFCQRVDSRKVNKRVIQSLIKCGAFDFTRDPRAQLMATVDLAMNMGSSLQRDRQSGQARLFEGFSNHEAFRPDDRQLAKMKEWPEQVLLANEKEALGFYITGHPLAQFEELLKTYANIDTSSLSDQPDKREVRFGGMVARLREITTRKGSRMGFVTVEDLKGTTEVVVFSDLYEEMVSLLKSDRPIFVVGTVDSDGETVKVIGQRMIPMSDVVANFTKSVHFYLHSPELKHQHLQQLKSIVASYPGACPGYVHLVVPEASETVLALPKDLNMTPSPELVRSVQKLFGHNVTRFSAS